MLKYKHCLTVATETIQNMSNRIYNTYLTAKAGFNDLRKRRLISKRVASGQCYAIWRFSPWRYLVVTTILLAFLSTRSVSVPSQSLSAEGFSRSSASSNANLLRSITGSDEAIDLAVRLAQQSHLPIEENVVWLAESNALQKEIGSQSTEEMAVARAVPVFDLATVDRTVKTHIVKDGESLQQIADSYGISTNTIKWANDMAKDDLEIGKALKILPLDGIIYAVKDGDTLESLADKYKSTAQRIQIFNDLELAGLQSGQEIVIPEGILPTEERPGYVAPVVVTYYTYNYSYGGNMGGDVISRSYGFPGPTAGNRYFFGNCTWYAYERRVQLGRSIDTGGTWGHAYAWAASARALGYAVNNSPAPGAIIQTGSGGGGYGHVGVVEQVEENGDIIISDMNYAGYNVVTWRRISAASVANYNYIH